MDFAKAQYERIRQQLNGLSASQRMLTVTLLVIMGVTLMYWVRYAGKPEMEALLDQPMAAEDVSRIREKLQARGSTIKSRGTGCWCRRVRCTVRLPGDRSWALWWCAGARTDRRPT